MLWNRYIQATAISLSLLEPIKLQHPKDQLQPVKYKNIFFSKTYGSFSSGHRQPQIIIPDLWGKHFNDHYRITLLYVNIVLTPLAFCIEVMEFQKIFPWSFQLVLWTIHMFSLGQLVYLCLSLWSSWIQCK
jgi:hypothetical protein